MKVAFLHYHLKTGGVTSVLQRQVECIHPDNNVLILSGAPPAPGFPFPVAVIDAIGYDRPESTPPPPEQVAAEIDRAVRSHFAGPCDLLHVHNPLLAKNRNLLRVLKKLQEMQYRLLLQVHDFAEDGRPLLYYPDPYVSDCHYAVINSRDYNALLTAGCVPQGVHRLPNMVALPGLPATHIAASDLILYPIRAIRRKNIGEAILLSLFFTRGEKLAITLPPNSPADFPSYEGWKRLVARRHLNIEFEAGLNTSFPELVRSSQMLITTSIMEGFGFAYLEPWLAEKLLWGRKLPQICTDFEQNGVGLKHLYTALNVPLHWIDLENFKADWKACVLAASGHFQTPVAADTLEQAFGLITAENRVDFGLLNELYHKRVISRILDDPAAATELTAINPWLASPADVDAADDLITSNRMAVEQHYSSSVYRKTLMDIYRKVAAEKVHQRIDKRKLLAAFFSLETFSLLKWGPYVE